MVVFIFCVLNRKYPFGVKFSSKNQNCHFKMKFGTTINLNTTNLNIQYSIVVFTSAVLNQKYFFWKKFVPKHQHCLFKLKCDT